MMATSESHLRSKHTIRKIHNLRHLDHSPKALDKRLMRRIFSDIVVSVLDIRKPHDKGVRKAILNAWTVNERFFFEVESSLLRGE